MKRIMISYAIGIVIFWAIISLVGCAAQPFHRVIHIPAMTVHVYQTADETPGGWATRGSMGISARMVDGKIVLDKDPAWHEIQHVLQIECPLMANPDEVR
jgi:hypothetical protein